MSADLNLRRLQLMRSPRRKRQTAALRVSSAAIDREQRSLTAEHRSRPPFLTRRRTNVDNCAAVAR